MNIPSATYRVQLSSAFTFKDLTSIITYLNELGVSTVYASPFFQARKGSTHGYDVTNPLKINKEIGTLAELREIDRKLKNYGMTWLQDIVPNHMAFDKENKWLFSVLELASESPFYTFFDIDWNHPACKGKIMVPVAGDEIPVLVRNGEIKLNLDTSGFCFHYYEHIFPVNRTTYAKILRFALEQSNKKNESLLALLEHFNDPSGAEEWETQKEKTYSLSRDYSPAGNTLKHAVDQINSSPDLLLELLDEQHYKLVPWKTSEQQINYRRFFTINDLICLNMQDEHVFQYYHKFIKDLCDEGIIQGLRIDHIDGLFDPPGYLEKLNKLVGNDHYIIIEKILEWDERLPLQWPVQGTSGYGFLALVSHLFTNPDHEAIFAQAYKKIYPLLPDYQSLIYEKKVFILEERMGGELNNLYELLKGSGLLPEGNVNDADWLKALTSFLAGFPVYRIYPGDYPLTERQRSIILKAYEQARQKMPERLKELDHLRALFLGEAKKEEGSMKYFVQRCQQFTGPLAAKGVEDTSFYIFNQLISHNEVGDSPNVFGIETAAFHQKMIRRLRDFPFSINATATHDTKRGEDARMRLNVLSELPEEWFSRFEEWEKLNDGLKSKTNVPDRNEEYFIYQSLLGAAPFGGVEEDNFSERTQDYIQKVLREAKVHTDWSDPNERYEQKVQNFVASVIENDSFRKSFDVFKKKIAHFGALNSLGMCLIKTTAPGIPDVYQGAELWDLSYVDPDNRRPVDYDLRKKFLEEIKGHKNPKFAHKLLTRYYDGRVKMYVLFNALNERRASEMVFNEGEYIPLTAEGKNSRNIISYARQLDRWWYVVIVPKLITEICPMDHYPLGHSIWGDCRIALPQEAPKKWINVFTDQEFSTSGNLPVYEALSAFPVALLKGLLS